MQAEYYTSINVTGTQKELKQIIDFFCPELMFHNANKHNRIVILTNIMRNREENSQE